MCYLVCLASDQTLELVSPPPGERGFNVYAFPENDGVRQRFTKPNVVAVGSSTGCSCGFRDDDEEGAEDRAAIAEYVARLNLETSVELYVCWDGEEEELPTRHLTLSARDLASSRDWVEERTFVVIEARAATP